MVNAPAFASENICELDGSHLGHAMIIGGCLFLAYGLTSWYMTLVSAAQGLTIRKPIWLDDIPIISGLLLIAGGGCVIVTEMNTSSS